MQIWVSILAVTAAIYVALCTALFLVQRKMLYIPQPAMDLSSDINQIEFDAGGVKLQGWVINPGNEKALQYFGGNAEQIEQHVEFFKSVLPQYTVYLVPYRGYGNSEGQPAEKDLYRDAEIVYDTIAKNHTAVSLIGRSLGSGVATHIAASRPIEKLVLITPYDSIQNVAQQRYWMFPMGLVLRDKHLSWKRADRINAPTLVLLAENDTIIPHKNSENLVTHFSPGLATVVTVAGSAHNDISSFPRYRDAIASHLNAQ